MQAALFNTCVVTSSALTVCGAAQTLLASKLALKKLKRRKRDRLGRIQPGSLPSSDPYARYWQNEQIFLAKTNFTPREFDEILAKKISNPAMSREYSTGGRPRAMSEATQLFLVLNFLKTGATLVTLMGEVGMSAGLDGITYVIANGGTVSVSTKLVSDIHIPFFQKINRPAILASFAFLFSYCINGFPHIRPCWHKRCR